MGVVISVPIPVPGDALSARLFLLDGEGFSRDTLVVAEVLAARVAGMFEEARLLRELRRAAAAAERLRMARDLHDGLLQALAGASLQLRTLHGVIRENPERAVERLTAIEETLTAEQRALRQLIRSAQPTGDLPLGTETTTTACRLHALVERLQRRWQVEISLKLLPEGLQTSASMEHDLTQILSEAVANAARHGGASHVGIDIHAVSGVIRTVIEDNGCGFPFVGTMDEKSLEREQLGPRSLRERVTGRGGHITVESKLGGARLEIELPRGRVAG
jgi:signal transduction histidine kinase